MNLHGIAGPVIAAVNPTILATFQASLGPSIAPDGTRTPVFGAGQVVQAQVQELTQADLAQIEGLNLQGTNLAVYLYGSARGAVRVSQQGGDLITIPSGPRAGIYLVLKVLELWPDWVKVAVVLQNQQVSAPGTGLAIGGNPP